MKKLKKTEYHNLSIDEFDEINNPPPEVVDFDKILQKAMTRRNFMKGSFMLGTSAFVLGSGLSMLGTTEAEASFSGLINFKAIKSDTTDDITIPEGYTWDIVAKWGDPLFSNGKWFDHYTRGTGESQELAYGDNNDGMDTFYTEDGKTIIAVNNEYVNREIIYDNRGSKLPETEDDVRKGKAGHGVSIFEISNNNGKWEIVKDSKYNRRITADSRMELTGPARGHALLKTISDPTGTVSLGTWNNCGNGKTPWGTYLTCEENFNGYFSNTDPNADIPPEFKIYGISTKDWGYAWGKFDNRFNWDMEPNEPNRAGYVVEIDPLNPSSTPKKRTALGRFKHENAEVVLGKNNEVIVYLGDDERGEYLYKFVSSKKYNKSGNNSNLLEDGNLFVAKFSDNGTGEWLPLTPETTGMKSKAEIAIHTRMAASAAGGTTMDRPEWVSANPLKAEAYVALTNNTNRGKKPNAGGDDVAVNGPNPRAGNKYGQIVRWTADKNDHASSKFKWDIFVLAGNPSVHSGLNAGSKNINKDNMFNSPDGIKFDSQGGLWIQTDGNYSNKADFAEMGNNQMLYGDPKTGEIKRFLVGPNECEVTGLTWSKDYKTMFVGIQHPGEKGNSNWPDGPGTAPRSALIVIRMNDGSRIG